MGDLTRALVDLGVAAERRRNSRSDLRAAMPAIVTELLRHLRTGDAFDLYVDLGGDYPEILATYEVERVKWNGVAEIPRHPDRLNPSPEERAHPKGAATLIRWPGPADRYGHGDGGAVLFDPRTEWSVSEWDGLAEREVELTFEPNRSPTGLWLADHERPFEMPLHIATDDDLVQFAAEVERVIEGLAERFTRDADRMRGAVKATAKYGPR